MALNIYFQTAADILIMDFCTQGRKTVVFTRTNLQSNFKIRYNYN